MNSKKDYFASLLGQAKIENLSHAYLVVGGFKPKIFIETYKLNPPDILMITEKPIQIRHIRELIHWLYLKPHSSSFKLAVLSEADKMTLEAANALLKILEEPPADVILILQAERKEKILPTILSRCQIVRENNIQNLAVPANFLKVSQITHLSIKERFDYVAKIIEEENLNVNRHNLAKFINFWEEEIRLKLLSGEDVRDICHYIFHTRHLLSTNTSVKLLLENLLLKF